MAESSSTYSDTANVERIIARIFVVFGGLFWAIMPLAADTQARYSDLVYRETDLQRIIGDGMGWLVPLGLTIIVFVLGLFYEKLTAYLLFAAVVATVVWGITQDWYGIGAGMALWMTVGVFLISPMVIAGVLYLLAARTDEAKRKVA